jgi:hypothetical protein
MRLTILLNTLRRAHRSDRVHDAAMRVSLWMLVVAMMVGCVGGDDSSTSDGGAKDGSTGDATSSDGSAEHCVFGASHFGDGCKFGP